MSRTFVMHKDAGAGTGGGGCRGGEGRKRKDLTPSAPSPSLLSGVPKRFQNLGESVNSYKRNRCRCKKYARERTQGNSISLHKEESATA